MRESTVEAALGAAARAAGGTSLKIAPTVAGVPDRIVLLPGGRHVLVETKAPGRRPGAVQRSRHAVLAGMGHPVAVVDTPSGARALIKSL